MYRPDNVQEQKEQAWDARQVVNYLWGRAQHTEQEFTPLQMIKLVYYCHGWLLGIYQEPLICQSVEAWRYGPVIAVVYHSLKRYGGHVITRPVRAGRTQPGFTAQQTDIMDQVFDKYHHFTGRQLSSQTHMKGTPWHTIWASGSGQVLWEKTGMNPIIPDRVIADYFASWYHHGQS